MKKFFLKIAILVTSVGMIIFLFLPKQLASIYKASEEVINSTNIAFRILALGFVCSGISLVLSASFQAFGNGTYSLIVNLSRKIIIVLPLIFIFKEILGIYSIWISFTVAELITMIIAIILYNKINKNIIEKICEE